MQTALSPASAQAKLTGAVLLETWQWRFLQLAANALAVGAVTAWSTGLAYFAYALVVILARLQAERWLETIITQGRQPSHKQQWVVLTVFAAASAANCLGPILAWTSGRPAGAVVAIAMLAASIFMFFAILRSLAIRGPLEHRWLLIAPHWVVFSWLVLSSAGSPAFWPLLAVWLTLMIAAATILVHGRAMDLRLGALEAARTRLVDDVTAAHRESEEIAERLRHALSISAACVWEVRPLERLVIGHGVAAVFGRAIGWEEVSAEGAPSPLRDLIAAARHSPKEARLEHAFVSENGVTRWVESSVQSVDGLGERIIVMSSDISAQAA